MVKGFGLVFLLVVCFFILFTDFGFSLTLQGVSHSLDTLFSFADSIGR